MKHGWYSLKNFDDREYEYYEQIENGDINWIIPNKFLAFLGPVDQEIVKDQPLHNSPDDYIEVFKHFNITRVIRLNEPDKYQAKSFTESGIAHSDLFFVDGSTPP